jgi:hypothetical protein
MAVRYWDYYRHCTGGTSTTSTMPTWTGTATTASSTAIYPQYITVVKNYVITGADGWLDEARANLTRVINDETNTGFKITMWMNGDVDIVDPAVTVQDLDWFLFKLRQVSCPTDFEKISACIEAGRAEAKT